MADWNYERLYDFGAGMYRLTSVIDPKFPDGAVYSATNMVYAGDSNNPEGMYGATRLGSTSMGSKPVSGLFDFDKGTKLVACSEDGKVYQYTSGDWAVESGARATGNSTTEHVRWGGVMFYGQTSSKNLLVMCNDADADDPVKYDGTDVTSLGGSPPGDGKFPVAWQGRCWMADHSTLYYSAVDDCEDWSIGGGGGSINVYRGFDGEITGLAAFANQLFVFKRSSVFRIGPTATFSQLNIRNVSQVNGCISHQTIAEGEIGDRNILFWISEHGIEAIGPTNASAGFEPVDLARNIKPYLENRNITGMQTSWGLFNLARKEYYAFYPSGTKTVPSVALVGNTARPRRPARWTTIEKPNITAGVCYNENNNDYIQYVGDNNGAVYKMHDESVTTWDGAPMLRRLLTKYYTQGAPEHMKRYGWTFVSADRYQTDSVNVRQIMLRQGLPAQAGNTSPYDVPGALGWGAGEWGKEPWGGTGEVGTRIRPPSASRAAGMQMLIEGNTWWKLKGLVIASRRRSDKVAA